MNQQRQSLPFPTMAPLGTENPVSATFERLLMVLEKIALNGPITLNELSTTLPISRGSIWRVAQALRRRGWIRVRNGDNAFEISHDIDLFFANAHVSAPECSEIEPLLVAVKKAKQVHVSVGLFLEQGQFALFDSSYKKIKLGKRRSLVFDEAALAAQCFSPKAELARHLKAFLESANTEERKIIESGEHLNHLEILAEKGVVWSNDQASFSVPIVFATGTYGAVTFFVRTRTRRTTYDLALFAGIILLIQEAWGPRSQCVGIPAILEALDCFAIPTQQPEPQHDGR